MAPALSTIGRRALGNPVAQAGLLRRWLSGLAEPVADAVTSVLDEHSVVVNGPVTGPLSTALAGSGVAAATVLLTGELPTGHADSSVLGPRFTRSRTVNQIASRGAWHIGEAKAQPVTDAVMRRLPSPRSGLRPRTPVLVAASPVLVPRAPDWPSMTFQTGAFMSSHGPLSLDRSIEAFLEDGKAPVFVGFGSMGLGAGGLTLDSIVRAAVLTGERIITPEICGLRPGRIHPQVLATSPVVYDHLFPRMAAIVHHGGAGTTHAALRAGRPSAAFPFGGDQTFHAWRLHRLGVGPAPLMARELTPTGLADQIHRMVSGEAGLRYRDRARIVGARIRREHGVDTAISVLRQVGYLA